LSKSRDAFRTISEVSEALDTPAHVLRFWESKFTQVKPVKRAGGRRYYRPNDVELIAGIKQLLHNDGMTIKGAQKLLREKGVKSVAAIGAEVLAGRDGTIIDVTPATTAPEEAAPKAAAPKAEAPAKPVEEAPEVATEPTPVEANAPKSEPALTLNLAPKAAEDEAPTKAAQTSDAWRSLPADPADSASKAPARIFHLIQTAPQDKLAAKAEKIAPLLDRMHVLRDRITAR